MTDENEPTTRPRGPTPGATGTGGAPQPRERGGIRRLDPLSLAALTVISLAVAIFVTLGIITVFGDNGDGAVDVTDALESTEGGASGGSLELGQAAPDATLDLLGGGSAQLGDLRGTPVVLNFWSSTCAPCLAEMPDFESVHQDLDGRVAFMGIDVTDTEAAGADMVARTGVTYPNGRDPGAEVMGLYAGIALPRTVIIDADGDVAAIHNGPLTAEELEGSLKDTGLVT